MGKGIGPGDVLPDDEDDDDDAADGDIGNRTSLQVWEADPRQLSFARLMTWANNVTRFGGI